MKILNKIIEEREVFGKELFGSKLGSEPNTEKENTVYTNLLKFFNNYQKDLRPDVYDSIVADIKLLFDNRDEFPEELIHQDRPIYRFQNFNHFMETGGFNLTYDFDKTLQTVEDESTDMIYLGSIENYGYDTEVSSWTVKPLVDNVLDAFANTSTILMKSEKYDNTVVTYKLSERIKELEELYDDEYEVIKVNNKKAEKIDIVIHKHYPLAYSQGYIQEWMNKFNEQLKFGLNKQRIFDAGGQTLFNEDGFKEYYTKYKI